LAASLHGNAGLQRQHDALNALFEELIEQGVVEGQLRCDATSQELAAFVLSALAGATLAHSRASAVRLADVTFDGLIS
jgi:hypothetical protein